MFGPKKLDERNIYNPNLNDIKEAALRTYGEANSFFRKEELYLKDIEERINNETLSSKEDIYDESHAIASDLAKCCEMYLKALYIFEHNIPGNKIDELWKNLKNAEYKVDEKGNLIYKRNSGEITFPKYDSNGETLKDENNKMIYFDKNNKTYNEMNRGSKIKQSGHQLDRLIELLSFDSRLILETRMLTIPMANTEDEHTIGVKDILLNKGVLKTKKVISEEELSSWLEQHKKTFEEARYAGQKKYDVNVEFLYHLATQIKAVAQYKFNPQNNQKFTITDEEIAKLPEKVKEIVSNYSYLMSEDLLKLMLKDKDIKEKVIRVFYFKPIVNILEPNIIAPLNFYNIVRIMDFYEIKYVICICCMLKYINLFKFPFKNKEKEFRKVYLLANFFHIININSDQTADLLINMKKQGFYMDEKGIIKGLSKATSLKTTLDLIDLVDNKNDDKALSIYNSIKDNCYSKK